MEFNKNAMAHTIAFLWVGLFNVKAIQHHHLVPGLSKILRKFFMPIIGSIDFCDSTQSRAHGV